MVEQLATSFVLGLLTPLTAACVLPLYPGFLSYLSKRFEGSESRRTYAMLGGVVAVGVISFMLLLGLLFTTLLQQSLTGVIEIVSPAAFFLLGLASIALILDLDLGSRFSFSAPSFENPLADAFGFGFFFGAIVIPCNPAFIATFLARSFLFETPVSSIANFLLFGLGIGFPLLAFTLVSSRKSERVIGFLKNHDTWINRISGFLMLSVAIYYLVFVFGVLNV